MAETASIPLIIPLAGALNIGTAAVTRAALLAGLETARDIELDCAAGVGFDIGFVQLLVAARRQAATQGNRLTLASGAPTALAEIIAEGGFAGWFAGGLEGAA